MGELSTLAACGNSDLYFHNMRQPNNFETTKEATEMGYAPAQAMLG
jgi:hypothetical protein